MQFSRKIVRNFQGRGGGTTSRSTSSMLFDMPWSLRLCRWPGASIKESFLELAMLDTSGSRKESFFLGRSIICGAELANGCPITEGVVVWALVKIETGLCAGAISSCMGTFVSELLSGWPGGTNQWPLSRSRWRCLSIFISQSQN